MSEEMPFTPSRTASLSPQESGAVLENDFKVSSDRTPPAASDGAISEAELMDDREEVPTKPPKRTFSLMEDVNVVLAEDGKTMEPTENQDKENKHQNKPENGDPDQDDHQARQALVDRLMREPMRPGPYYLVHRLWWRNFHRGAVADFFSLLNDLHQEFASGYVPPGMYEAVPESVWQLLVQWYGPAPEIVRQAVSGPDGRVVLEPDVYPLHVRILDGVGLDPGWPLLKCRTLNVNLAITADQLLQSMQSEAGDDFDYDVKLWRSSEKLAQDDGVDNLISLETLRHLDPEEIKYRQASLRSSGVNPGDLVVVELKHHAAKWLSAKLSRAHVGTTGLDNLGNTCYMNSALQCLIHTEELTCYFLSRNYERHINVANPIGHGGVVAHKYASLLQQTLGLPKARSFSPREFKYAVGQFNAAFAGYGQQDSQEFLAFLLDGLHEDLNRVVDKPATTKPELPEDQTSDPEAIRRLADQSWEMYKKRNDSAVLDLFTGLYRSVLVCPHCGRVSITFDPFMSLTLPLPVDSTWIKDVVVFGAHGESQRLRVGLDKNNNVLQLKQYVAENLGLEASRLQSSELFSFQYYKHHRDHEIVSAVIAPEDAVVLDELDRDLEGDVFKVPVFHRYRNDSGSLSLFGEPFYITLSPAEASDRAEIERRIRFRYASLFELEDFAFTVSYIEAPKHGNSRFNMSLSNVHALDEREKKDEVQDQEMEKMEEVQDQQEQKGEVQDQQEQKGEVQDQQEQREEVQDQQEQREEAQDQQEQREEVQDQQEQREEVMQDQETDFELDNDQETDTETDFELDLGTDEPVALEPLEEGELDSDEPVDLDLDLDLDLKQLDQSPDSPWQPVVSTPNQLVFSSEALVCEFSKTDSQRLQVHLPKTVPNPELDRKLEHIKSQKENGVQLTDCLDLFSRTEVLGEDDLWYCSRCKELRQATKTIELWKVPDIFTIHLKRFSSFRSFRDKLDDTVFFPIEGLDMGSRVVGGLGGDGNPDLVYDLFAVDNHFGGLGGGHYTAYAKNFVDGKWYYYDDSHVRPAEPEEAIKGSAYLLFYRRRSATPLGSDELRRAVELMRERDYEPVEPEKSTSTFAGPGHTLGAGRAARLPWANTTRLDLGHGDEESESEVENVASPNSTSTGDSVYEDAMS